MKNVIIIFNFEALNTKVITKAKTPVIILDLL